VEVSHDTGGWMTRTKIDLSPERQLITHLIVDKQFAQEVIPILDPTMLKTRYAQIVARWVLDYYDRFSDVPGKSIQDIYLDRKTSLRDEEEQTSVAEFLQNLSEDYSTSNSEFYIDQAIKYLKTVSLEQTIADMQDALRRNEPLLAEGLIANYKRIGRPEGDGYSITDNPGDIINAFTEDAEVVLTYPGILGKVVGPCRRGDLVSFIAPVKRGKTWALLYSANEAMAQNKKVVFITLEMPKAQIIRRAWQSIVGLPKHESLVSIPYYTPEIEKDDPMPEKNDLNARWRIEYREVKKKAVQLDQVDKIQEDMRRLHRGGDCRFVPLASKATTVLDVETVLDNLRFYSDYEADMVVIDYADLMGAKANDYRHQLDDIWSNLKRVAQERNILILTATQTNRAGLGGDDIDNENVAEDMRKLAHVSKFIALNQSKEDKPKQIMRWKILLDRDEPWLYDEASTVQSLQIGKFVLDSRIRDHVQK